MHAMALPSLRYARGRPGNALDNAGLPRCTHPDNNSASRLLLPGLETGHAVTVGQSPTYDFSVSDEQKGVFLVSVSDCSECDSYAGDRPTVTACPVSYQARSQGIRMGGYILRGVWGSSPRKNFKFKGAITPKFNDFLQLPKKFWMSKYLLLMSEVPDLQAGIPRDGLQCTEHLKYMGTSCGGAVVLNDLEEFGLSEADEKSVSRQMPRSQMS